MDRDERKKMIEEVYKKMMGEDAPQHTVNQYLNMGIGKEQLMQKIVDSKEFEEMVKNASEYKDLKKTSQQNEAKASKLESEINDIKAMQQSQNQLLAHKNAQINAMQNELVKHNILKPGEYFHYNNPVLQGQMPPGPPQINPQQPQKGNSKKRFGVF
jgi:hypothetical protein